MQLTHGAMKKWHSKNLQTWCRCVRKHPILEGVDLIYWGRLWHYISLGNLVNTLLACRDLNQILKLLSHCICSTYAWEWCKNLSFIIKSLSSLYTHICLCIKSCPYLGETRSTRVPPTKGGKWDRCYWPLPKSS